MARTANPGNGPVADRAGVVAGEEAGAHAGEEHLKLTEGLLKPVGKVLRIPESQQDAATALSGSGPAYFFYLVEAMVDAGILLDCEHETLAGLDIHSREPFHGQFRHAPYVNVST